MMLLFKLHIGFNQPPDVIGWFDGVFNGALLNVFYMGFIKRVIHTHQRIVGFYWRLTNAAVKLLKHFKIGFSYCPLSPNFMSFQETKMNQLSQPSFGKPCLFRNFCNAINLHVYIIGKYCGMNTVYVMGIISITFDMMGNCVYNACNGWQAVTKEQALTLPSTQNVTLIVWPTRKAACYLPTAKAPKCRLDDWGHFFYSPTSKRVSACFQGCAQ